MMHLGVNIGTFREVKLKFPTTNIDKTLAVCRLTIVIYIYLPHDDGHIRDSRF